MRIRRDEWDALILLGVLVLLTVIAVFASGRLAMEPKGKLRAEPMGPIFTP